MCETLHPGSLGDMDIVQIVITVSAVLGIVVMGAMAVVPEVLDWSAARHEQAEERAAGRRSHHRLAA